MQDRFELSNLFRLQGYWLVSPSIQRTMLTVCLALTPGILSSVFVFGPDILLNLLFAIIAGLCLELLFYRLILQQPINSFPLDASGAVMAIIFALSLPPGVSGWVLLIGITFAIVFGKYIYGGTGHNLFNPAMVGVATLLVSFPVEMSQWLPTTDTVTGATPLDDLRTRLQLSQMISEVGEEEIFGYFGACGHEWINLSFLAGGLILIQQKIIRWHIPAGVLTGLSLMALFFQLVDPDRYANVFFHLFGGATMLCAFFVATDPVTSPMTSKGRLIYGLLIGITIYAIRTWGKYPEGVAFAVLMMNATVPVLDHFTRPKSTL